MAFYKIVSFVRVFASLGFCTLLAVYGDCRPASTPGIVTNTRVTHFDFFNRIVNPCEVTILPQAVGQQDVTVTTTTVPTATSPSSTNVPTLDFFHSMESVLLSSLEKLKSLESADPSLPDCNGISLDSLPVTPPMDNMNEAETTKQAYKTFIFLTSHFHLMSLDRQMAINSEDVIVADEQAESESNLPSWRFQRCGNETERFPTILLDVTSSFENVLCTILSSASDEQTTLFREPLDSLQRTTMYRYHTSCSTLQTRDCLVVREAKQAISLISRKYDQLITQTNNNNNNAGTNGMNNGAGNDLIDDNLFDNSI